MTSLELRTDYIEGETIRPLCEALKVNRVRYVLKCLLFDVMIITVYRPSLLWYWIQIQFKSQVLNV